MRITIDKEGSGELYLKIMKSICGDTSDKSMVDLMCYHAPHTSTLGFKERTYVDILDRNIDDINEQQYFIKSDVLEYLDKCDKRFDVSICSDGSEHLTYDNMLLLLEGMGKISDKQILFTPLGNHMVEHIPTDNPDTHKSGLTPEQLEEIEPNHWACILMPRFHGAFGSFFFWHCENIKEDFERVQNELKSII